MKLDPGIHIVMHSVFFLKPGVTATSRLDLWLIAQRDFFLLRMLGFGEGKEAGDGIN